MNQNPHVVALIKSIHDQIGPPKPYVGQLSIEFDTSVILQELACLFLVTNKQQMFIKVSKVLKKFVSLINKFYFAMYGEKAARLSDQDISLSKQHVLFNLPINATGNQIVVDQDTIDRCMRSTSNIISETMNSTIFKMSQFVQQHTQAQAQCKNTKKCATKINLLLQSLKKILDNEHEESHKYMNQSNLTYSDLTDNERKMKQRKRRNI